MRRSKTIGVDMDDVLFDFWGATRISDTNGQVKEEMMYDDQFFFNLQLLPGAKAGIFALMKMGFDVWIVSQPLADLPESYSEKAQAIALHFPQLYKKLILTQDKSLIKMDYLIDDNRKKWKEVFEKSGGKFIHFPYGGYNWANEPGTCPDSELTWQYIVSVFKKENPYLD